MTQACKLHCATPKQAARRKAAIDHELHAEKFRALGDPTRLLLLSCLAKCGRMCSVTEVAACCAVDFSVVSRHLALLAGAGVLESKKQGRTMLYRVQYGSISHWLRQLADAIDACSPTRHPRQANYDQCCC